MSVDSFILRMMLKIKVAVLALGLSLITIFALAQKVSEPKDHAAGWTKNYEPFRIVGNVYYVGTYDLACFLITTSKGHILINTGLAASAQPIKENVVALGFNFSETKILLTTQAHYDHMGAMAAIKKATGAIMLVDEKDAGVLADGGASDYALGRKGSTFEPVKADRLLRDGDIIELGDVKIKMLHHPGHTKGSCSFLLDVKDDKKVYKVLIANLPTIVTEKDLSDVPGYPNIISDYTYTFNAMKNLQFDIWLASHASQFGLHSKHKPSYAYNPMNFVDRKGYDTAIKELQDTFEKRKTTK